MDIRRWLRDHSEAFRLWRIERRLRNASTLYDLREPFRELGVSLDDLTDAQVAENALALTHAAWSAGMAADEAAACVAMVARWEPLPEGDAG